MASPKTIARLEARIQRRAAHCLQFEIADPRSAFITITHVELAKDLATAKIHYSVLGDEAELRKAEQMLERAAGFIQRQVARVLETRTVPHMRWVYDDSVAEAARLDQLIREARGRDQELRRAAGVEDPEEVDESSDDPEPDERRDESSELGPTP